MAQRLVDSPRRTHLLAFARSGHKCFWSNNNATFQHQEADIIMYFCLTQWRTSIICNLLSTRKTIMIRHYVRQKCIITFLNFGANLKSVLFLDCPKTYQYSYISIRLMGATHQNIRKQSISECRLKIPTEYPVYRRLGQKADISLDALPLTSHPAPIRALCFRLLEFGLDDKYYPQYYGLGQYGCT